MVKGEVCKTSIHRFESGRRLHFPSQMPALGGSLSERPVVGTRKREWTEVGPTEEQCTRNMAYCLREIGAGRVPK